MSQQTLLELAEELESCFTQFQITLNNLQNTIPKVCPHCQKLITGYSNISTLRKFGNCLNCRIGAKNE